MRGSKPLLLALAAAAFLSELEAQTVWSIEGGLPSYGEYNAPPPACGLGPLYTLLPAPPPVCPTNTPFPFTCRLGGSAVDIDGNPLSGGIAFPAILHSDGTVLEMTTPAGAYITSSVVGGVVLPGLISGVACDSLTDTIYLTDGFLVVGVGVPPGPPACGPPPIVVPPFPVVTPAGVGICGLGYDPCTGTLWACDGTGFVSHFAIGGAFLGGFAASPPLAPMLTGLTVNNTNGNLQVTDGAMVAEFTPAGLLAAPGAFYLAANPYPVPLWAAPVSGLGFSLRPLVYGRGCTKVAGGIPPSIGTAGGYPFAGNPIFRIRETGATPGLSSFLLVSVFPSCPALPIFGCAPGLNIGLPFAAMFATGIVPAAGTVSFPAPIPLPAAGPCAPLVGITPYFQFINIGGGMVEMTEGLEFTIGAI